MSSILTNNSAMVALQTLKAVNSNLSDTQSAISTGKSVASAKDNSAVWAISKVMESDVKGFKAISESLSLGQSTVAVARNGAEQITDLLNDIKGKVISANEENFDGAKLQADLDSLRDQITSIAGAAQFNGLNLLSNTENGGTAIADIVGNAGSGEINVLSSLDRGADGTVSSSTIAAAKQDLGTQSSALGTGSDIDGGAITVSAGTAAAGGGVSTVAIVGDAAATADRQGKDVLAGDSYSLDIDVGGGATMFTAQYVARDGDTLTDIAKGLQASAAYGFDSNGLGGEDGIQVTRSGTDVNFTNNSGVDVDFTEAVTTGGTVGGGLELLAELDVSTLDGAKGSLNAFEALIQKSIDAAASFGSSEGRIEIQSNFVSSLSDSLKSGIGALVDANMEETSARLQALQVQQQLAVQSLSIANQAPQSILSLFR
jgi:flagellin